MPIRIPVVPSSVYLWPLGGIPQCDIENIYVHSITVYQNYLTRLRELIIFEPWRENYHFSQPSKIFYIRQYYVRILFIFQRLIR